MSDLSLEICYLSASQALKRFKNKTLSPVELLEEIKKRIDDINPKINAFNFIQFEKSFEQAKAAEIKYSQKHLEKIQNSFLFIEQCKLMKKL